jgi:hypothetical protein
MPYITCCYVIHPIDPNKTSQPNRSKDPKNFIADEVVSLVKHIRNSDLKKCNVILDVKNKSVVKCRSFQINGEVITEPDYTTLLGYFGSQNPEQIKILLQSVDQPKEV